MRCKVSLDEAGTRDTCTKQHHTALSKANKLEPLRNINYGDEKNLEKIFSEKEGCEKAFCHPGASILK